MLIFGALIVNLLYSCTYFSLFTYMYILAIWGLGGTLPGAHPVEVQITAHF